MMSRQLFASESEEVLSFEGSQVDSPPVYHPGSPMRFNENVVFVQHVVTPIMLLEYIPVYINYQTYEPFLINRFQVEYIPFFTQAYINSYIPYYYRYPVPEVTPSSVQNQYDTVYSSYQGNSLDTSLYDESTYTDDTNSSATDSDDTSVLSLSSPYYYDSYRDSEFSALQEPPDNFQDFVNNKHSFDGESDNDDDLNTEDLVGDEHAFDRQSDKDKDFNTEDFVSDGHAFDKENHKDDDFNTSWMYALEVCNADDEWRVIEVDDPSLALMFEGGEERSVKSGLKNLERVEESSLENVEKETDSSHVLLDECDNHVNYDDRSDIESVISFSSLFVDAEKTGGVKVLKEIEESSLKNVEKETDFSHVLPHECDNHVNYDDRSDVESDIRSDIEYRISSTSSFVHDENSADLKELEETEEFSSKNSEKVSDLSHALADRCDNHVNFDDSDHEDSCISSVSSLDHVTKCQDENNLKHNQLSSFKNTSVKRCEMPPQTVTQIPPKSHKIMLQKPECLHNFDVSAPGLFHDVMSDSDNDSDGDPAINLQDILTSDEYLKVKREECMQKRRSSHLYRSCLEGDIHPRRPLPQVGTMATIFEDLPYPINEPYDNGIQEVEESRTDDELDLPPLEVEMERSNSTATLLPKKKRFRNTRKFFSGLFRCFRPP